MIGKAKLLKIYVGEKERLAGKSLYQHLVYWLKEQGVSGVTVLRGIEGYGQDKVLRTFRVLELSSDLPMVLEVVDRADKIEAILPEVCKMVPKGLVLTSDIEVHLYGK